VITSAMDNRLKRNALKKDIFMPIDVLYPVVGSRVWPGAIVLVR
jgi:hypothetical protein